MKITLEVSDEILRQYKDGAAFSDIRIAARELMLHASKAIVTELRTEVSCREQVVKYTIEHSK